MEYRDVLIFNDLLCFILETIFTIILLVSIYVCVQFTCMTRIKVMYNIISIHSVKLLWFIETSRRFCYSKNVLIQIRQVCGSKIYLCIRLCWSQRNIKFRHHERIRINLRKEKKGEAKHKFTKKKKHKSSTTRNIRW